MTIHRQYLCIFVFCSLQLLAVLLHFPLFLKCDHRTVTTKPVESSLDWGYATSVLERKTTESATLGRGYVESVLKRNVDLEYENSLLRELLRKETTNKQLASNTTQREAVSKPLLWRKRRKNGHSRFRRSTFSELVTIILYEEDKRNSSCIEVRKRQLQSQFPHLNILYTNEANTVGNTFNLLFPKVTTKYFYFLNIQNEPLKNIDSQVHWLLEDLEEVQELDFISGSILNVDKLEIPCYRLNFCNWTFSQKYEYRRSIDEIMICDNIGSSFMGKTLTVRRIFRGNEKIFDEEMRSLAITDFFLRVKKAGAVCGVRPEVMVKVIKDQRCHSNNTEDKLERYQNLLPFARKHKVFRFKDTESRTLDLCGNGSPLLGKDICNEPVAHEVMLNDGHWARMGTFAYPYIINNLQKCLFEVTELLNSKGIQYYVEGGVALGAIKMRSILPWDAGDVDLVIHHNNSLEFTSIIKSFALERDYAFKEPFGRDLYQVFCVSGMDDNMGGLVTMSLEDGELDELIKIKTNGHWISYKQEIFKQMRQQYGIDYLHHVMYKSEEKERINCKIKGHNACLPDFREDTGNAGTYSELFCQV